MKKNVFFTLAIALMSVTAVAQIPAEPKHLADDNLSGNVLAVKYGKYQYLENFGEPTTGRTETENVRFYDELGRSIFYRRALKEGSYLLVESYMIDYVVENDVTKVTSVGMATNNDVDNYSAYAAVYLKPDASFENLMKTLKANFSGCNPTDHSALTIDANGVTTLYDIYYNKWSNHKLKSRQKGNPTGTPGVYDFVSYKESGEISEKTVRSFSKGRVTKVEKPNLGGLGWKNAIPSIEPGTYVYDAKGRLTTFTNQYKEVRDKKVRKYYLNEHGDVMKITETTEIPKHMERETWLYWGYQYDAQGNWIYRIIGTDKDSPKYIEKREIVYGSSSEDIRSQNERLLQSAGNLIKAEQ